jgi:ABC-type amino acid transport system permease subunit
MPEKSFKAATIVIPDAANRTVLEEAFNEWSEQTKPTSILHIHYYHDLEAHARGYQVVYEEPWMPYLHSEVPKEEETAHLLV